MQNEAECTLLYTQDQINWGYTSGEGSFDVFLYGLDNGLIGIHRGESTGGDREGIQDQLKPVLRLYEGLSEFASRHLESVVKDRCTLITSYGADRQKMIESIDRVVVTPGAQGKILGEK